MSLEQVKATIITPLMLRLVGITEPALAVLEKAGVVPCTLAQFNELEGALIDPIKTLLYAAECDNEGRIVSVTNPNAQELFTYNEDGTLTGINHNAGMFVKSIYNPRGLCIKQTINKDSGEELYVLQESTYDENDSVTHIVEANVVLGEGGYTTNGENVFEFEYDAMKRIVQERANGEVVRDFTYNDDSTNIHTLMDQRIGKLQTFEYDSHSHLIRMHVEEIGTTDMFNLYDNQCRLMNVHTYRPEKQDDESTTDVKEVILELEKFWIAKDAA